MEAAVPLVWSSSIDNLDWEELAALYRAAPLGNKDPAGLKTVFSNSMFRSFVYDAGKLVGVGRALADGVDCSYICDVALLPGMSTAMAIFEDQDLAVARGYLNET